jgi:hypothetical protein
MTCWASTRRVSASQGSAKTKQASLSQPVGASIFVARYFPECFYNLPSPDLFAAAQRLRIPSASRLRAAADMLRRFFGAPMDFAEAGLLAVPGGLPRRFPGADSPTPCKPV